VLGPDRRLCDGEGRALARFDAALPVEREQELAADGAFEYLCDTGNLYGSGGDVLFHTSPGSEVWIFHNPDRAQAAPPGPASFGLNYTLY
jgi:hypothetical protein